MENENSEAIREAFDGFYHALNLMFTGDLEPMKTVWSHADDITYMGPSGHYLIGWSDILADWEKQAAMKLGGHVKHKDTHIIAGEDLGIVSHYAVGENVNTGGHPTEVNLRGTSTFRKENGQWKMIGHQSDKLPFLEG